MQFNRELFGQRPTADENTVFLIGMFRWFPCMPGYAYLADHIARKYSATIEWYNFYPRRELEFEDIFRSFGARPGLSLESVRVDEEKASQLAKEIFHGLRTKFDVLAVRVDGAPIGDLIYDTYLRTGPHPTVDIADPKLEEIIQRAILITRASQEYFSRKKVVGIIPDHFTYIFSGIITRCAMLAGVPVYQVCYGQNFFCYTVAMQPDKRLPARYPCPLFRRLFARLTPEQQEAGRTKGRQLLQRRLAGYDDGILVLGGSLYGDPVVKSAYSRGTGEAIMEKTGRPRILILLHDFCDAVHHYGDLLLPDFYEWCHFLLRHASETEFDWYVKPHPNSARAGMVSQITNGVLAELKEKYPRMRFLSPTTSSLQLLNEGIDAMFTGYGTAGHEFAYLGVPVVNAGENAHVAYEFNLHPQNLEEYAHYIAHADRLKVNIRKEDIEEFAYMHYCYYEEQLSSDANPMPAAYFASDEFKEHRSRPETLEWMMHRLSPEERAELDWYFDHIPHISEPLSPDVRVGKTRQPTATILNY